MNSYYAELDEHDIVTRTLRTDDPAANMVPCTKRILATGGRLYPGRLPPRGYRYDAERDVFCCQQAA